VEPLQHPRRARSLSFCARPLRVDSKRHCTGQVLTDRAGCGALLWVTIREQRAGDSFRFLQDLIVFFVVDFACYFPLDVAYTRSLLMWLDTFPLEVA
jgi:hypothetical protein